MSIRRAPRPESNFYLLDKSISEDDRLSWAARGMLIFLLGKPDNWVVSVANLINETSGSSKKSGRDAVYAILKELETAGYLSREKARTDEGEFGGVDYIVHESPLTENPYTANPDTDEPDTVNPTQVSIEGLVSNEPSARIEKPSVPSDDVTAVFEHWREVMGKTQRGALDSGRKTLITKALKTYSLEDVKAAISGCALSPYHMGENPSRKQYNGLALILRNAEKIEQFIGYTERQPASVYHMADHRPRPKHTGLDQATDAGLNRRADGTLTL